MIALKIAAFLSSLLVGTASGAPALLHGTIGSHGSIGGSIGGISSHGSIGGIGSIGGSIGGGSIGHGSVVSHEVIKGGHGGYEGYSPQPFHFAYGVNDDYSHVDFSEQRSGDGAGNIEGEYTVALPDGRIQHVTYHADGGYGGTVMEVSYQGEAHYPENIGHGDVITTVGGHGIGGSIGGGIGGSIGGGIVGGSIGGHGGIIGRL